MDAWQPCPKTAAATREARPSTMLRQKTIKHEAANATAAALVLRNRDAEPVALVLWAEAFQKRQRAERANRATLEQLPLQGVTCEQN